MSLGSAAPTAGDQAIVKLVVQNKGGNSSGVTLNVSVPSGATLVRQQVDRGSGCAGATTITCNLDFFSANTTSTTLLWFAFGVSGKAALSATVSPRETDANVADNSAALDVDVAAKSGSGIPGGLNSGSTGASGRDKVRPSAHALKSSAVRGKKAALRFKIYDDRGVARATGTVKRGARTLATLKTGFGPVTNGTIYFLPWKTPAKAAGPLKFCVVATDRGGNKSVASCAPLSLR